MAFDKITAVVVNHKTLGTTRKAFTGLAGCYPNLQILLVDNASEDESTRYIEKIAHNLPNVSAILNRPFPDAPEPPPPPDGYDPRRWPGDKWVRGIWKDGNLGHTGALHQAFTWCKTPYLFTLDSDCVVLKCGFLEKMLEMFSDPALFAVGYLYAGPRAGLVRAKAFCVHGSAALWDVEKYRALLPFEYHNGIHQGYFEQAAAHGWTVADFPVGGGFRRRLRRGVPDPDHDDYISHESQLSSRRTIKPKYMKTGVIRPELMDLFLSIPKTDFVGDYFDA